MKTKILAIGLLVSLAGTAEANFGFGVSAGANLWGSGAWGGMQGCPYGVSSGISDDYLDLKADESDLKAELKDLKRDLKDIDKDVKQAERNITGGLSGELARQVMRHLEDPTRGPRSYQDACNNGGAAPNASDAASPARDASFDMFLGGRPSAGRGGSGPIVLENPDYFCVETTQTSPHNSLKIDVWQRIAQSGGKVDKNICSRGENDSTTASKCKRGIDAYSRAYAEKRDKEERMAEIQDELAQIKAELRSEKREMRRAQRDGDTEGGFCFMCAHNSRRRRQSNLETIGQIGLGALGAVLQYRGAKDARQTNARLGWPSMGYMSSSPWPYAINGMLGIMGGINGAYGCGAMMGGGGMYGMGPYGMMGPYGGMGGGLYGNMGGAFGYPGGWGSPLGGMGGGMYMPGMGPWGMAGPWGLGHGMMSPMMGGNPYMSGGLMGNPYAQMGLGGFNNPFGMGSPFGGGMMSPFGGMGGPFGGMGGPFGGMGGPYGNMFGGGQMNMQMMQAQQQQMQMMMQAQQQYQQQQQQRSMMVGQLQQELYRIQSQIQQIMYGSYFGAGGFSGGFGASGTFGQTGTVLPFPGSMTGGNPAFPPSTGNPGVPGGGVTPRGR